MLFVNWISVFIRPCKWFCTVFKYRIMIEDSFIQWNENQFVENHCQTQNKIDDRLFVAELSSTNLDYKAKFIIDADCQSFFNPWLFMYFKMSHGFQIIVLKVDVNLLSACNFTKDILMPFRIGKHKMLWQIWLLSQLPLKYAYSLRMLK